MRKDRRQEGDKRSKKEKKTTGEADPEGDCSGSAGGEEKGRRRESCVTHREKEGRRRRRGGEVEERGKGLNDLLTPPRMHHRRLPSDQEGPLGDQPAQPSANGCGAALKAAG